MESPPRKGGREGIVGLGEGVGKQPPETQDERLLIESIDTPIGPRQKVIASRTCFSPPSMSSFRRSPSFSPARSRIELMVRVLTSSFPPSLSLWPQLFPSLSKRAIPSWSDTAAWMRVAMGLIPRQLI